MELTVLLGVAVACAAGGVVPWLPSEVALVGAAMLVPEHALPLLIVSGALGQMVAKCGIYALARWAPHRISARAQRLAAFANRYRGRTGVLGVTVFSGAFVAVPPFYLVTLASGILRVPFVLYALAGAAGTVLRYGVVVWAAAAVGAN